MPEPYNIARLDAEEADEATKASSCLSIHQPQGDPPDPAGESDAFIATVQYCLRSPAREPDVTRQHKDMEEPRLKDATNCLFCRIAAKAEPAALVHEDELSMSFMDIHPLGKGHVLVITKQHAQKLEELDERVQMHLFTICNRIVAAQRRAGLGSDGTHFLLNDGAATNQHIPHVHFHLVPRTGRDSLGFFFRILLHFTGLFGFRTPARTLQEHANRIRQQLQEETIKHEQDTGPALNAGAR